MKKALLFVLLLSLPSSALAQGAGATRTQEIYSSTGLLTIDNKLSATAYNNVIEADRQTGSDDCAKINSAYSLLPSGNGVINALGFTAAGTCTTALLSTATGKVRVLLDVALTINVSETIPSNVTFIMGPNASIAAGAGFTVTQNETQIQQGGSGPNSDFTASGAHVYGQSIFLHQTKNPTSNLNAAALYLGMEVTGDLGSHPGAGDADWGEFVSGRGFSLVNNPAFYEIDGIEAEADYGGSLAAGNNLRLVSVGAQSFVDNSHATDTAAVPHAISIYARPPFKNGSTGTASIQDAVSFQVDEPSIGTSDNHGIILGNTSNLPSDFVFYLAGIPNWNLSQDDNASTHSYDFSLGNSIVGSGGLGYRVQNSANGNFYLGAGGTGSVIICGAPTFGGEGPTTQCTGGLKVFAGGPSGSIPATPNGNIQGGKIQSDAITFATAPACSASLEGSLQAFTDSTTATWGATITGGGTNHVLGYCDGAAWTVTAK